MNHIEQLNLFVSKSEELSKTGFLNNDYKFGVSFMYNRADGLNMQKNEPDEEHLRSFLLVFRQFISKKEPIYLERIYNICQTYITNETYKEYLQESRNFWKELHNNSDVGLIINDRTITPEFAADLWINGYYFHNDHKKRKYMDNLQAEAAALLRIIFISYTINATRQIHYVGNIVGRAFKEGTLK